MKLRWSMVEEGKGYVVGAGSRGLASKDKYMQRRKKNSRTKVML